MPRAWTDDDAPFARDGMQAHERVKALVETLEVTKARDARRETTLALCEQMRVGGASAMSYAMSIGARGMLIKALNLAMREGDEEAMDAVGNALGKASGPANREAAWSCARWRDRRWARGRPCRRGRCARDFR